MADAKRGSLQKTSARGWQQAKSKILGPQNPMMAQAANLILSQLKRKNADNEMTPSGSKQANAKNTVVERLRGMASKQRALKSSHPQSSERTRTPSIPVAIVKGKQSLKHNEARSKSRSKTRLQTAFKNLKSNINNNRGDERPNKIYQHRNVRKRHEKSDKTTTKKGRHSIEETDSDENYDNDNDDSDHLDEENDSTPVEESSGKSSNEENSNDDLEAEEDNEDGDIVEIPKQRQKQQKRKPENYKEIQEKTQKKVRDNEKTKAENQKVNTKVPNPPPPPPSQSSIDKSLTRNNSETVPKSKNVDNSGGGSVLDRIKMFQNKAGGNEETKQIRQTKKINESKASASKDQNEKHPITEVESVESKSKLKSRSTEIKKSPDPDKVTTDQSSDSKPSKIHTSTSDQGGPEPKSKPKPNRKFSDASGYLIPYETIDEDDDPDEDEVKERESSDEGSDEDDRIQKDDTRNKPSTKDVESNKLENNKAKDKTIKNNMAKQTVVEIADKKKQTTGKDKLMFRNKSSSSRTQTQGNKNSRKTKTNNSHQRLVEAQIEIINENQTSSKRRSKPHPHKGDDETLSQSNATGQGLVPSIKIEDFSDKKNVKTNERKDNSRTSETTVPKPDDDVGHHVNASQDPEPTQDDCVEPKDSPDTSNQVSSPGLHRKISFPSNENKSITMENQEKEKSVTFMMKSKAKLAKWRRIASGLKGKNNKVTTSGQGEKPPDFRRSNTSTQNLSNPSKNSRKSISVDESDQSMRAAIDNTGHVNTANMTNPTEDLLQSQSDLSIIRNNVPSSLPSPLIDYFDDDKNNDDEFAVRKRRRSFLNKRASLASIRSDRPSAVSDDSAEESPDSQTISDSNKTRVVVQPQVRQQSDSMTEVIGQDQNGDVIIGITNARLEIASGDESASG